MIVSRLCLHVGYQKTGSTWLRQHLFNNSALGFSAPFTRYQMLEQIVYPHAFDFDPALCHAYFDDGIMNASGDDLCPVLSLERLSGNPVSGGYDSKELADRLANTFPDAKVMIVIREQKSMILSSYKEYIKSGGPSSLLGYLDPPPPKRIPYFDFDHYKYHRLIRYYFQLFGRSHVIVLPFEMFNSSPLEFLNRFVCFVYPQREPSPIIEKLPCDERVNVGFSGIELEIKRHLSMLFGERNSLNLHSLFPTGRFERTAFNGFKMLGVFNVAPKPLRNHLDKNLITQVAQLVGYRYTDSNRQTSQLIGIDLATYGYDLDKNNVI